MKQVYEIVQDDKGVAITLRGGRMLCTVPMLVYSRGVMVMMEVMRGEVHGGNASLINYIMFDKEETERLLRYMFETKPCDYKLSADDVEIIKAQRSSEHDILLEHLEAVMDKKEADENDEADEDGDVATEEEVKPVYRDSLKRACSKSKNGDIECKDVVLAAPPVYARQVIERRLLDTIFVALVKKYIYTTFQKTEGESDGKE